MRQRQVWFDWDVRLWKWLVEVGTKRCTGVERERKEAERLSSAWYEMWAL